MAGFGGVLGWALTLGGHQMSGPDDPDTFKPSTLISTLDQMHSRTSEIPKPDSKSRGGVGDSGRPPSRTPLPLSWSSQWISPVRRTWPSTSSRSRQHRRPRTMPHQRSPRPWAPRSKEKEGSHLLQQGGRIVVFGVVVTPLHVCETRWAMIHLIWLLA